MSLRQKKTKGIPYWLFTAGRERTIHLGPVNDPTKINPEKVLEALDYIKQRYKHYTDLEDNLISFLPTPKKEVYLSATLTELDRYANKVLGSLSEAEQEKYCELRQAELQTRRRQIEPKLEIKKEELEPTSKAMAVFLRGAMASNLFTDDELKKLKQAKKILDEKTE